METTLIKRSGADRRALILACDAKLCRKKDTEIRAREKKLEGLHGPKTNMARRRIEIDEIWLDETVDIVHRQARKMRGKK